MYNNIPGIVWWELRVWRRVKWWRYHDDYEDYEDYDDDDDGDGDDEMGKWVTVAVWGGVSWVKSHVNNPPSIQVTNMKVEKNK